MDEPRPQPWTQLSKYYTETHHVQFLHTYSNLKFTYIPT